MAVNHFALENLEKKGSRPARLARQVLARMKDLLATILIGNTLANIAAASIATSIFVSIFPGKSGAVLLATLTTTLLILIFSELTPKTFAVYNPLSLTLLTSYPIKALMAIFYPAVKAFSFLTELILPASKFRPGQKRFKFNEDELRLMLTASAGELSTLRQRMISGALDISSRPVKEIMVPRPKIRALSLDAPIEEIMNVIESSGFSRYPIYKGKLDNIEGFLHAKDILKCLAERRPHEFDIKTVLRPPYFLPELAMLEHALLYMQKNSVHMAIIVDEFGSVEGLVTLEDIIEELVGDIRDEYDRDSDDWVLSVDGSTFLLNAAAPIKEVNRRLNLNLPEKTDYATLAGFFLYEFGHLPKEKDRLDYGRITMTVEKMAGRLINLISVTTAGPADKEKP